MPSLLYKIFSLLTCFLPVLGFIQVPSILAPILPTISSNCLAIIGIICGIIISIISAKLLLIYAKNHFEKLRIKFSDAQPVNREMFTFFLASLTPIIAYVAKQEYNFAIAIFCIVAISGLIFLANSYYINPIIGFLGYKIYQVKAISGVSYLLITKDSIYNLEQPKKVVYLTEHIYLLV